MILIFGAHPVLVKPDPSRAYSWPGFYGTKTNSVQTEAGARAELGNRPLCVHMKFTHITRHRFS